jgi:ATP-dependent protease ClpP protease subunit
MADQETLLERLIPGDLEHQIPQAIQKVLPGGFKNRMIQGGLALLLALGLTALVRRWIEARERGQAFLPFMPAPKALLVPAPTPAPTSLPAPIRGEPPPAEAVALPVIETATLPPPPEPPHVPLPGVKYPLLGSPHVHLSGTVDHAMYQDFREQLTKAPQTGTLVIAISTLGGDPEVARLMGDEIRLLREYTGREILFLGKVAVYSAGATFMSAFPVDKRFLTRGTRIMIHERQMISTVELNGPLKSLTGTLKAKLHEIEQSVRIEEEGFRDLVAGSTISFDEVRKRAPDNWYIDAEEARDLGLVLDVI